MQPDSRKWQNNGVSPAVYAGFGWEHGYEMANLSRTLRRPKDSTRPLCLLFANECSAEDKVRGSSFFIIAKEIKIAKGPNDGGIKDNPF